MHGALDHTHGFSSLAVSARVPHLIPIGDGLRQLRQRAITAADRVSFRIFTFATLLCVRCFANSLE